MNVQLLLDAGHAVTCDNMSRMRRLWRRVRDLDASLTERETEWSERNRARLWWTPLLGLAIWPLLAILRLSQGLEIGTMPWVGIIVTVPIAVVAAIRERKQTRR